MTWWYHTWHNFDLSAIFHYFSPPVHVHVSVCQWNLVCSRRPLKQMIQTIYMGGVLTGAIIFGSLSDRWDLPLLILLCSCSGEQKTQTIITLSFRFGRKSVLIWSYLQLGVLGCSSALSPSYMAYCVFRFLSGMAVSGIILNGLSLSTCPAVIYLLLCFLYLYLYTVYLFVLRGGMDPNQVKDTSGNAHLLLLHLWSDDLGRTWLLAERLEEAAVVCLCSTLPVLRLQLVSAAYWVPVVGQVVLHSLLDPFYYLLSLNHGFYLLSRPLLCFAST